MSTYTLISGVESNREHPDTFYIPGDEDKHSVQSGDYVKLMFDGGDLIERMWVEVTEVGDTLKGTLANNPFGIEGLEWGDEISFSRDHIIDITN